jgi:predicted porin
MAHKIKALAITIGAALALTSFASQAEITLKQDPQAGDPLSRLNFTVGGSIRPQFNMMSGDDKGSYKRNGFDGGTRFRFAADYYLFDDISWISYYELGSIFRRFSTGITTTPKARITPAAVCSIPA